jgi:hypothetical protein
MSIPSRKIRAGVVGLLVAGAGVTASAAASLGGLNVNTLGADDAIIASCDSDGIDVDYVVVYNATAGRYDVSDVVLSGVAAACDGLTVRVALRDGANAAISTGTGVAGASGTVSVDVTNASAEAVQGVAVVIS